MQATLECPCCGDDGAIGDDEGKFYDGQGLVCGCPGMVSLDAETEPYVAVDECAECVACSLRRELLQRDNRIAELERLAYIGEHHFPGLTYKARCEEQHADIAALERALSEIATLPGVVFGGGTESPWAAAYRECKRIARVALRGKGGGDGV